MKITSCGVIYRIKNTNKFLVCRVTGSKARGKEIWTLPKGGVDEGETFEQAAIRETFEETGISLRSENLKFLVNSPYLAEYDKYLVVFEYPVSIKSAVDVSQMKCSSCYTDNKSGRELPEVNKFEYIDIKDAGSYLNRRQYNIIKDLNIWN